MKGGGEGVLGVVMCRLRVLDTIDALMIIGIYIQILEGGLVRV